MKRKIWFFLTAISCVALPLSARAATVTIDISNFAFVPAAKTIAVGDTVTWMNNDISAHTATSGQPGAPSGVFNSGTLAQDQSFSFTFNSAGDFPYYCAFHFMIGTITVQAAQGEVPTVSITNPANNATIATPGQVLIEATASSTSSTISKVEFFDGTTLLGEDTSSPYSFTANLAAGTHSLTAKATDAAGASATSSPVTVTVGSGGTKIADPIPTKIAKGNVTIELQTILDGLVSPLGLAVPDDNSGRMFLYDQVGLIYVVTNGAKMTDPLLDVRSRLVALDTQYDERGLLGVATHPNFAAHPFVYTYTSEPNGAMADFMIMYADSTTNNHQSVIAEWRIDPANTNRLDPASRREIMRIDKPQSNHNGGTMRFGPDGFLYFTVGDGGAADDQGDGHLVPGGNAQDKTRILGKVVRIDVDTRNSANGQYGVPADNPFVNEAGAVKEIYAYGVRNPYSFSFDRQTGDLLLGDVGQNDVEEADKITKGGNFGWPIKEGTFYFDPNGTNAGFVTTAPVREVPPDLIEPFAEFDHDEGKAIIGGYGYHGAALTQLANKYIFGDWGKFEAAAGRLFYLDGTEIKELKIGATDRSLGLWLKGFGEDSSGELYIFASTDLGPTGTSGKMIKIVPFTTPPPAQNSYLVENLVSDVPGLAPVTDPNLANPWGLAFGPSTFFWISDNHTGVSTLYNSLGATQALVVTIPPPTGAQPPSAPTGVVFNNTTSFDLGGNPSRFIFVTEDGTVAAWYTGSDAVIKADNSASGAIYKGVAIASSGGNNYLYAADFHNGKIDVFDSSFAPATLAGSFSDPTIPAGFAPFNIVNVSGNLYVTYAKQDDEAEDDVPGNGNGYVNIFNPDGTLQKRFASTGSLNSPWGITMAPATFGQFGGKLLIGDFGDGAINAFDPATGDFLGHLTDANGAAISIQGLWDLKFGNGMQAGDPNKLYFTAGIAGGGAIEDHGLFGSISYNPAFMFGQATRNGNVLTLSWRGGTPPYLIQMKSDIGAETWTDVKTVNETTADVPIDGATGFFRVSSAANPP